MLSPIQIKKINTTLRKQITQKFGVLVVGLMVVSAISYLGAQQGRESHAGTPAARAELSMQADAASVSAGETINVTLYADSGTARVNAVQTSLTYNPAELQYVGMTERDSFQTVAATSVTTPGVIRLARGTLAGHSVSGMHEIATLTFKALAGAGATSVEFDRELSYVVRSTDNKNLLSSVTGVSVLLKQPASQD